MKKLSSQASKEIFGGHADQPGFKCKWEYAPGTSSHGLDNISLPATTPNGAQALAMAMCASDPNCCSVKCPGATYTGINSI